MKQSITAFLILLLHGAHAQQQVGFKAGVNMATLEPMNEKATPYKRIVTSDFGILINFPIATDMYLQGEINYRTQGGNRTGIEKLTQAEMNRYHLPDARDLYANLHNRITLNYLDIPVLIKFTKGDKIRYYMSFGPSISYLISCKRLSNGESLVYTDEAGISILKQDGNSATTISQENTSTNIKGDIKKINLAFQAGWGFEYKTNAGSFFVETKLLLGATNIQANTATNGKTQTTSFLMSSGYMINLKKK